jgi:hypothetical protein
MLGDVAIQPFDLLVDRLRWGGRPVQPTLAGIAEEEHRRPWIIVDLYGHE